MSSFLTTKSEGEEDGTNRGEEEQVEDFAVTAMTTTGSGQQQDQQQEPPRLSVASLRRSSAHHTPTRTLQLSEREERIRSRSNSDLSSPLRSLLLLDDSNNESNNHGRPRSNQRNRTPMRANEDDDSSMHPDALRTASPEPTAATTRQRQRRNNNNNASSSSSSPLGRITIRPLAGAAVGTTLPTTMERQHRTTPGTVAAKSKSRKQGQPSHRKLRRWNNDRFEALASEMSRGGYLTAAQVLLRAHEDAHLYRSVYDPSERRESSQSAMREFMEKDELQGVRQRFFEGDLPSRHAGSTYPRTRQGVARLHTLTPAGMLNRVDGRLRRVVVKSCTNSYAAGKVVELFESFVVQTFSSSSSTPADQERMMEGRWWKSLLLQEPAVTPGEDKGGKEMINAQFLFAAPSSNTGAKTRDPEAAAIAAKGGFHRILLHAVCQFHGLRAVSKMVTVDTTTPTCDLGGTTRRQAARALVVTAAKGAIETEFRLLDCVAPSKQEVEPSEVGSVHEKWDMVSAVSESSWTVL